MCSLDFLVKFLEQEVCRLNWDVGFVTFTMQEIGVQLPRMLEVYDQLFKTRVRELSRNYCSIQMHTQLLSISFSHNPLKDCLYFLFTV